MTKIVYNACYGGFGLSKEAFARYKELGGTCDYDRDIDRTDWALIHVIEELGGDANNGFSKLRIIALPTGTKYHIHEYDGFETVMTPEDYDWKIA